MAHVSFSESASCGLAVSPGDAFAGTVFFFLENKQVKHDKFVSRSSVAKNAVIDHLTVGILSAGPSAIIIGLLNLA